MEKRPFFSGRLRPDWGNTTSSLASDNKLEFRLNSLTKVSQKGVDVQMGAKEGRCIQANRRVPQTRGPRGPSLVKHLRVQSTRPSGRDAWR